MNTFALSACLVAFVAAILLACSTGRLAIGISAAESDSRGIGMGTDSSTIPDHTPTPFPITTGRGRVQVVSGNVVADSGYALRGEHIIFSDNVAPSTPDGWLDRMYDASYWSTLRDDFHFNTLRLMIMRPPQNWPGGPGNDCFYPVYRCYDLGYTLSHGRTVLETIDDVVNLAAREGMYIIIDYHPVGGLVMSDALEWWTVIAPRYKDRTHVIYEAANEPVAWNAADYTEEDIDHQNELYRHIRSLAPNSHIILWSFANATGPMLEQVLAATDIDYANASVGFHPYSYDESAVTALRQMFPVINTEIGEDRLFKTEQAEAIGVSWIWLYGAHIEGVTPDGLRPEDVFWPKDPGTVPSNSTSSAVFLPIISDDRLLVASDDDAR